MEAKVITEEAIEFRVSSRYYSENPATEGKHVPQLLEIPLIDEIVHDGTTKIIRFIRGESSIFQDDQDFPVNKVDKRNRIYIYNGMLQVMPYEKNLLEYLRASNFNESNPNRDKSKKALFYEVKPVDDAKSIIQKELIMSDAVSKVLKTSIDELIPFATYLGLDTRNYSKRAEIIRSQILKFVKDGTQNAELFMSHGANDTVQIISKIKEAEKLGIISHTITDGAGNFQWSWHHANGKTARIVSIPSGEDVYAFFKEYLSKAENSMTLERLTERIDKANDKQ